MSSKSSKPSPIKLQDEPFNLDIIEKEASGNDYRFILGGREFNMPALGRLDKKVVKKIAKMSESGEIAEVDYIDEMLKAAMGEEQFTEFDELPLSQAGVQQLFENWTDHSGIEVPESSASSSS